MKRVRVIPVLLLQNSGVVKTVKFKNPVYIGDPINAVKIFNEKEIDEIVILDIDATKEKRGPNMEWISEIAGEAFIPLAYGGGITKLDEVKKLFYIGVEKVVINSAAVQNPDLISKIASEVGSQSVVVSVDIKKSFLGGYKVYIKNGNDNTGYDPISFTKKMQEAGAGEIFLNCIDKDGTYAGYDLGVIEKISKNLTIPLVVCGGASSINDFREAVKNGASAVAAGSMFVFQRPHQAVLISYPTQKELKEKLFTAAI
jgi:imidazole glycerol-phosphate synthase subunit HisF